MRTREQLFADTAESEAQDFGARNSSDGGRPIEDLSIRGREVHLDWLTD
jgi:hypothetical protein